MIYLVTAIGLTPGGSSTFTHKNDTQNNTINNNNNTFNYRTTQLTTITTHLTTEQHN